jgi:hypothetical protein
MEAMDAITEPDIEPDRITTYRSWWPAAALLPDKTVWQRVRAYATSAGLIIYRRVPDQVSDTWGALTPDWFSPIDMRTTQTPRPGALPGQGFDITTEAGLVVITHVGGCGCGMPLKRWRPSFSTHVAPWPTTDMIRSTQA